MTDRASKPEGHAVENGVLRYVSPSQIKSADGCLRAWWFDKVGHLPRKQIAAQAVGTEVHAQIEHYLRTGENVLGPIALAGKHHLPAPGADLVLEAAIMPLEIEGIPIIGYVDLVNPRQLEAHGLIEVTDHKTTSSIERYAKGVDEILKDPQLAIYCTWALQKWAAERVTFAHIYYQTRGAKCAEKVSVPLSKIMVRQAWAATEEKVRGMKVAAAEKDPVRVPCSLEACTAYGGCSFAGACSDSPARRNTRSFFDAIQVKTSTGTEIGAVQGFSRIALDGSEIPRSDEERARKPMSLMERLQKKKAASPAPAPAAAPTNVAAPAAPAVPPPAESAPAAATVAAPAASTSTPATASGAIPASKCKEGDIYQLPIDKAAGRPEVTFGECKGVAGSWVLFQAKSGIARVRVTEQVYTADVTVPAAEPEAPKAEAKPTETTPAAAPATEAPKRTRKAKTAEPAGTSSPAAVQAAHEANAQLTDGILVLLVNCVSDQPAQDLTGYVANLASDAAKVAGVADVRIANDGPLAFGKWKGHLATMARESPPSGRCVIFSGELADPVIEALSSIAAEVIRGR